MIEEMLPGFNPGATATAGDAGLGDAAAATIDAARAAGDLTERHALHAQMLLVVAQRAGAGLCAPRTTIATTNLVRLAYELMENLPASSEQATDSAAEFFQRLREMQRAK